MLEGLKIAVIGGDRRHVYLVEQLGEAGLSASLHACGGTDLNPEGIAQSGVLLLPAPATDGQGHIRTPMWGGQLTAEALLDRARPDALVLAGLVGADLAAPAHRRGIAVRDYFAREDFTVRGALITAEGALSLALSRRQETLWGSDVLITGMGRIAKILLRQLAALGARVTVAARRPEDRVWAGIGGAVDAVDFSALPALAGRFGLILNTVPQPVIGGEMIRLLRPDCLIIDLASKPGGVDFAAAEAAGIPTEWALGLPGKTAPISAAAALRDAVLAILAESGML